jgi:murein DD-endopeptidase MepM/ murein hydrolase activator NlpD
MIVCLSAIPILLAIKFLFPAGARAVSDHLAGGLDYKAAFAALGRAITGEEKLAEVFRGISFGAFQKDRGGSESTDGENKDGGLQSENGNAAGKTQLNDDDEKAADPEGKAVEAVKPVDIIDEIDLPDYNEDENGSNNNNGGQGGEIPGAESDDKYLEELLLRLPSSDYEDESDRDPDDIPENVSYDYYVIEFDYEVPLKGNVNSGFGYRKHPITGKRSFHYGVDIGGSIGDPVNAFSSGTVELTGYNYTYGNYLFLRHKDGIITFYGHLNKVLVQKGQLVQKGELVAKVGSTGLSTGPHLHFEVHNGNTILDPLHYISPEG